MTSPLKPIAFLAVALLLPTARFAQASFAQETPGGSGERTEDVALALDLTRSESIDSAELRGHVRGLSADELKGRKMGTPEGMVAAKMCVKALKMAGLGPGAGNGTFLQRLQFARTVYSAPSEVRCLWASGEELTLFHGESFTFQTASVARDTGQLRCLTVTAQEDIPAEADPDVALVFSTSAGKAAKWLREAGHDRGAGFGAVVIPRRGKGRERSVPRTSPLRPMDSPLGALNISLRGEAASRAKEGELRSIQFISRGTLETSEDANVVAVLPGAGELKEEFVILCAHRDHIGESRPRGGAADDEDAEPVDRINNGADDDASGCAVVLEIAEALALAPPEGARRSLVVLLVTGEEVGFIGSKHWVANPTVPLESVVCALNFEMLGRPDPMMEGPSRIWLTGDDRSDLGPHLRDPLGIQVASDPRLEMNFFVRSDNVPFAKAGVVSQTLSSYGGHSDYHRVTDEWDTLDYDHMEAASRECELAVEALLTSDWTPSWNEGEPSFN